jgi:hypothetical protein
MGEGKRNSSLIAWSSAWDMLLVPSLNGLMSIPTRNGLTMRSNGLVSSSDSENGARDRQGSKTGPCRGLTPTRSALRATKGVDLSPPSSCAPTLIRPAGTPPESPAAVLARKVRDFSASSNANHG